MRYHEHFEWEAAKARASARKHGVTFDDAARVLGDEAAHEFHVEDYDDAHSMEEERWITTASHPDDRTLVLRIVWTQRGPAGAPVTRIISARLATREEASGYAEAIAKE